jgi:hypothetical protein
MDEESMRNIPDVYDGYVAGKIYRSGEMRVRLEFNPTVEHQSSTGTRLDRFNLRMFEQPEAWHRETDGVEMAVSMTTEQWLDLISAMQAAVEDADETRRILDGPAS